MSITLIGGKLNAKLLGADSHSFSDTPRREHMSKKRHFFYHDDIGFESCTEYLRYLGAGKWDMIVCTPAEEFIEPFSSTKDLIDWVLERDIGDVENGADCDSEPIDEYQIDYLDTHAKGLLEIAQVVGVDFLEMLDHLLSRNYRDWPAVIVVGVLKEHLRKLCVKHGIPVTNRKLPKKAETLNTKLSKAGVYSKLDQKNVTAWLNLRNKAAHGHHAHYTQQEVELLPQAVRDFLTRNPA